MKHIHFVYDQSEKKRVDLVIASRIPSITRSQVSTLFSSLKVNGKDAKLSYKLKMKDDVIFEYAEPKCPTNAPENIHLNIVYEDENVIVVNKQSHLTTHPCNTSPSGTLVNALNYYRLNISSIKDEFASTLTDSLKAGVDTEAGCDDPLRQGIVHRLDKDTTGLIITARNKKTSDFLKLQFKAHRVKKFYIALLDGVPKESCGIIKTSIYRSKKDGRCFVTTNNLSKGRTALTRFRIIQVTNNISLAKFRIYTGRTHQIRVHAKYLGAPVLHDALYGKRSKEQSAFLFLHAYKLELDIAKGVHKVFTLPLPKRFREYLRHEK